MRRAFIFCAVMGLAPTASANCPKGTTTQSTPDIVQAAVAPYQSDPNFVGLAITIIRDGSPSGHVFGAVKKGGTAAPDNKTLYQIGSVTKTFTGLLLAVSTVKGLGVNNGTMLSSVMPTANPLLSDRTSLILADLARHSSGFAKNSCVNDCEGHNSAAPPLCFSKDDLWRTVATCPLVAADPALSPTPIPGAVFLPPVNQTFSKHDDLADVDPWGKRTRETQAGKQYHYSNVAFAALGRLLEKQIGHGKTWEDLIQTHIAQPLGMVDTLVDEQLSSNQRGRRAFPMGRDPKVDKKVRWLAGNFPTMNPEGALYSTVEDMKAYLNLWLGLYNGSDAKLKLAALFALGDWFKGPGTTHTVHFAWETSPLLDHGCVELVSKDGATPGFRTWAGFVPSDNNAVIIMANWTNGDPVEPSTQIGEQILRALHGRGEFGP